MIRYRTLRIALLLTLAISTASAQKKAPAFPIIPPPDTTMFESEDILGARRSAASLALAWLRETKHPGYDAIDFPQGLVTSLRNALLRIAATTGIPALDSVRMFDIQPEPWVKRTASAVVDRKKARWALALLDGKKKTGNGTIDRYVRDYGLRAVLPNIIRTRGDDRTYVTFVADSLINIHALEKKIFEMKGLDYIAELGMGGPGWKKVTVSVVDGKWRLEYHYAGTKDLTRVRFIGTFDVDPDGRVEFVHREE